MSDLRELPELPDLVGEVRDRVVVPPYAEVSRRVRARRVRGALGAVVTAVVVVAGLAVWQNARTTAGPAVPRPADTTRGPVPPTDESQWREVVYGTDSHPFGIAGTDDGAVAVVWRALEPGAPTFALVVRAADGTVHGRRLDEPVSLTPVPGGWVGIDGGTAHLIRPDGSWTDLETTAAARSPRAGDVVVRGRSSSWLYSPMGQRLSPMPELDGGVADAYVTPQGDLVTCRQGGRGLIFVSPTGTMVPGLPGDACVVAGRGDDAVVVALGDDPDGGIPMTGLATMTGLTPGHVPTWRFPEVPDLPSGVTSVVVTPGGSTAVTDAGDGRWLLVRPDGEVTEPDRRAGAAFVAGDRLFVTSYAVMNAPLYVSDDDGRTWQETTLPGNESNEE